MKAFTLIELLISAVVLILLMGGVFSILNIANMDWYLEVGLLNVHQQARQAMHGMVRELRQSRNQDITITSGGATIEFTIPQSLMSDPITYYQPIRYYISSNQVIREHPLGTTSVLANNAKSLSFCFWDDVNDVCCDLLAEDCSGIEVMQISLDTEKDVRGKDLGFSVIEKVKVRNE